MKPKITESFCWLSFFMIIKSLNKSMEFFSGLIRVISLLIAVDAWFPNQLAISENRYWTTSESSSSAKRLFPPPLT